MRLPIAESTPNRSYVLGRAKSSVSTELRVQMRLQSVIGGGANSADQVHFEVDVVGSLIAEMERLGIASDDELRCETLAERVIAEVKASDAVVVGRSEVGAWCRLGD